MTEPDWLDEREQRAWRGYLALNSEIQRRVARQLLRETGLTSAEYAVLVSLSEAPGGRLRVFQLRSAADWEKTRLTHQITRMTARGLVAREPCPDDPRGAFVVLTEAGWEAVTAAAPRHVAHVRHWFFDALQSEQVDALLDISRTVLSRLPEADRVMGEPCTAAPAECGERTADYPRPDAECGRDAEYAGRDTECEQGAEYAGQGAEYAGRGAERAGRSIEYAGQDAGCGERTAGPGFECFPSDLAAVAETRGPHLLDAIETAAQVAAPEEDDMGDIPDLRGTTSGSSGNTQGSDDRL